MPAGYYKTKSSVEEYISLAKDVNGSSHINKLKTFLPTGASVLELGSGPGTDWRILSKNYSVTGSDNSEVFLEHLKNELPDGRFLLLEADAIQTDDSFDGIYSNKVLHHLTDDELKRSVTRQDAVLNLSGLICHTFWRGEGSEIFKGLFVNYHNEESLRGFFEELFEILLIERYTEFEEEDSLLLIARKRKI